MTDATAGLDLESLNTSVASNESKWPADVTGTWEKIARRLQAGQMPPVGADRPTDEEYREILAAMHSVLDDAAEKFPSPGNTDSVRRLNRTEYGNSIRDLLGLHVDVQSLLPGDSSGHGFDNVTVSGLPPALVSRYITAAERIARQAVGTMQRGPSGRIVRIPADRTQESHVEGLPLGTRGGIVFEHNFVAEGKYEIQVRLMRDRDEHLEGLFGEHEIDVLIDRSRVHRFTVQAPKTDGKWDNRDDTLVDANLKTKLTIPAGVHQVGVTFPQKNDSLSVINRKPFVPSFNRHRHPRPNPALYEVSITGPLDGAAFPAANTTPVRRKIFGEESGNYDSLESAREAATKIIARLARAAYRRPVNDEDIAAPLQFFERECVTSGFDSGIESAISAILVNPHFLLRAESTPPKVASGDVYRISDIELASRLSFFIWSSIPDDELLQVAEKNRLHEPATLRQQVKRMLADERAGSLVENFAGQWLYLRNLANFQPDRRLYPDFDDNLRHAMRRETELCFERMMREDMSVLSLIDNEETFLNERLATHYEIPGVLGSHFRPLNVSKHGRGGLLRHASILSITSYATRTSPTIRGNWILKNILGIPAAPPPPDIPALPEKTQSTNVSIRERLAEHRANPACASCHDLMDPVGFALETFDATGRQRMFDQGLPIDSKGTLPDGSKISGAAELTAGILQRPEMFVGTLTDKLLTFALGRGTTAADAPAIRKIVQDAADKDYCFSSLITGIATSTPFQMRVAE